MNFKGCLTSLIYHSLVVGLPAIEENCEIRTLFVLELRDFVEKREVANCKCDAFKRLKWFCKVCRENLGHRSLTVELPATKGSCKIQYKFEL